jgi:hypothetical protein
MLWNSSGPAKDDPRCGWLGSRWIRAIAPTSVWITQRSSNGGLACPNDGNSSLATLQSGLPSKVGSSSKMACCLTTIVAMFAASTLGCLPKSQAQEIPFPKTPLVTMYPALRDYIDSREAEFHQLSADRRQKLDTLADAIHVRDRLGRVGETAERQAKHLMRLKYWLHFCSQRGH